MKSIEDLLLAWWKDQWDAKPVDKLIADRAEAGVPEIAESEVAIMRAAQELFDGDRHHATALCEQMAINLRANAINCKAPDLRRELEGCAETADQCALSIRAGRIITQYDRAVSDLSKRTV